MDATNPRPVPARTAAVNIPLALPSRLMIQYALVGCGRIAQKHLPEMLRTGTLAALCDTDEQRARQLAAGTGARVYTQLDELLEQEPTVTVVVVCSPNGQHAEHAIKSLQARRHVLVEKPMCLSSAAAWSMRDTAHFFRRKLFVVQQNRFALFCHSKQAHANSLLYKPT